MSFLLFVLLADYSELHLVNVIKCILLLLYTILGFNSSILAYFAISSNLILMHIQDHNL